jgi:acyl-CoA thioester hydrolase
MPATTDTKPSTSRTGYTHWASDQVRWSDTDMLGHCNNLAFGAFAETGRCLFMRRFFQPGSPQQALFLPVQITLGLLGEVFWPAQVEIGTGIAAIGTTSVQLAQGLFEGDRCFGTCATVFVLIDEATRRPRPIPPAMRELLLSQGGMVGATGIEPVTQAV